MCDMPRMTAAAKKREDQWRAEEDCRTLERAEEVRADKTRMAGAARYARTQIARMKRVAGGGRARGRR